MKLSDFIRHNMEKILQEWENHAFHVQPAGGPLNKEELRDHAEKILLDIADGIDMSRSSQFREERSRGMHPILGKALRSAVEHGITRHGFGFDLNDVLSEYRALRKSVVRLWAENRQEDLHWDEILLFNEELDGVIKEAVEAFTAAADRQKLLLEKVLTSSRDHCYLMNGEGRFIYANSSLLNDLNIAYAELMGKTHKDLHSHGSELLYQEVLKVLATGEVCSGEVTYSLPTGEERIYEYIYEPIVGDVGDREIIEGVAALERDITERIQAEKALQENEKLSRLIFENSRDGIHLLDLRTGQYTFMSSAQERLTGFTLTELENLSSQEAADRLHPDDVEPVEKYNAKVIAGEELKHPMEYRWRIKSGEYRWFSDSRKPVRDQQGKITALVGVSRDITVRKEAEEQLHRAHALLHSVTQGTEDMIAAEDLEFRYTYFNEAYAREFRKLWKQDIKVGTSMLEAMAPWPEERQKAYDLWHRALQGEPFKITLEFGPTEKEKQYYDLRFNPLRDPEGRVVGAAHFLRNVTAEVRTKNALRRSEERWNLALENIEAGVIIATEEAQVIYWNPAARKLHGLTSPDEGFRPLEETFDLWTPDRRHKLELDERPVRRIKRGETLQGYELRLHRPDQGWEKYISYSGSMVETAEGEKLIFLSLYDLTELRESEQVLLNRTEDLAAANRELEAFSYSVSHDLRAPLHVISTLSSSLRKHSRQLDSTANEILQRIEAGAKKMNHLINDILRLSKISRHRIIREEIDLSSMARTFFTQLQQQQQGRHVEVRIDDDLITQGDAQLLTIALNNLFRNAWKYTSKEAKACIEVGCCEQFGKQAFFIRDNGAGFSMEQADRLFQPFQRLHSDSEFPGTGIGLPIVQRVINRHGGEIWAESEVGKGATFYFTLG